MDDDKTLLDMIAEMTNHPIRSLLSLVCFAGLLGSVLATFCGTCYFVIRLAAWLAGLAFGPIT